MVARALLADVDIIILNRTEGAFNDEKRDAMFDSLKEWVNKGLNGSEKLCAGVPRLRTVFVASHSKQPPVQADAALVMGSGPSQAGLALQDITDSDRETFLHRLSGTFDGSPPISFKE